MQTNQKMTGYPSIDKPWLNYYEETKKSLKIADSERYVNSNNCQSMYQSIWDTNHTRLDYIALEYFNTSITYRVLFDKINHIAGALIKYGIKPSDCVSLCLPNIPEIIYFIYATHR